MDELNKNGYIILKNSIYPSDIPNDISSIKEKVNYTQIKEFIDNKFIPIIKRKLPYFSNPNYTKFRYSNNNNSIDASIFHQDVYNNSDFKTMPIFTALVYFDKAELRKIIRENIGYKMDLPAPVTLKNRLVVGNMMDILVSKMIHNNFSDIIDHFDLPQNNHNKFLQNYQN